MASTCCCRTARHRRTRSPVSWAGRAVGWPRSCQPRYSGIGGRYPLHGEPVRRGIPFPGHRHQRSAERRVADVPAAAGGAHDRVADGQPEARAVSLLGRAVEPVEQRGPFGLDDAGAAVFDGEADTAAVGSDADPDCAVRARIRQALSISTPARWSIHSGGALISAGPAAVSAVIAGPTARNRSAQACARIARSTGSSRGGGRDSNRASHSMSSTRCRSRTLSPWIRTGASR